MPKYYGKQIFTHGRFPEVGEKEKTGKKKKKKRERAKVGDNNGQATHGARKHAWRTQATWAKKEDWTMVITMAKLRMAHASMHGAHKPPGPKVQCLCQETKTLYFESS